MSEADPLRARTFAAIAAKPSLTRRQAGVAGRGLVAASVAVGVMIFEGVGGFEHGADRPIGITIASATGWSVVAAILTWLVLARSPSSAMPRWPLAAGVSALLAPIVLFSWMHHFYGRYPEPYEAVGYRCLWYSLLISTLPLGSFLALRRAIEPRFPALLGAAAGAACAAWAGALVDIWCPLTNPGHILIGHLAPLAVATAAGAIAGHFTLGARRTRKATDRETGGRLARVPE